MPGQANQSPRRIRKMTGDLLRILRLIAEIQPRQGPAGRFIGRNFLVLFCLPIHRFPSYDHTEADSLQPRTKKTRPKGTGRRLLPVILCTLGLAGQASGQAYGPADLDEAFGKATMVISASSLACYRFDLWLARERPQQTRGLMFVRDLPDDTGMLFIYAEPGRRSMWMKNTYLPLDMLFIREDGTVSSIVANTEPLSLRSISSEEPVTYVLELNAGITERLGIVPGDRIL